MPKNESSDMNDLKTIIQKYALQNAIKHDGKASFNAIVGKVLQERPDLKRDIQFLTKAVNQIIDEVNKLEIGIQKSMLKKIAPELLRVKKEEKKELPELPNIKDKIILRIAPFPSGPLHIGNAYPFILNDHYAKKYKGKLILVMDDTIGSKEKDILNEAYKLIPESLKWLNINFDEKIIYKSDRLNIYYKYAEELIKEDKAYVCSCSQEKLKKNRLAKKECKCRKASIEKNLENWKKMFKAKQGSMTLRIKTSMKHKNPAFRDRVIFRISNRPHPRTKKKYRVWPLLDFSWAIDDHLLNITHIIRGKELMIESEMEKYIWNIFKWPHPEIIHTGLLQLKGIKLSKSKSRKEVLSKKYTGWDDPRTWSLQALKQRGIKPEAIRNFCLSFGLTNIEVTAPVEKLYAENKKIIEPESNRYYMLFNPEKIKIKNAPKLVSKLPVHPDYPRRGFRIIKANKEFYIQDELQKNQVYRFMHLFNFKNNEFISANYDPELKAKLIHWLPTKGNVKVEVVMPDGIKKIGVGEKNLTKVKIGETIQAERFAYLCLKNKTKNKLTFYYSHP